MGLYADPLSFAAMREKRKYDIERELKRIDQMIADATESLERNGWPEIATELSFLHGKRTEVEQRLEDLKTTP